MCLNIVHCAPQPNSFSLNLLNSLQFFCSSPIPYSLAYKSENLLPENKMFLSYREDQNKTSFIKYNIYKLYFD